MKKTYHLKLVSFITIIAVLASMLMTQAVFAADDGTMTFIDECNDFSKVYSRSGDLRIFNDQPQVMKDNDTGRIGRDISARTNGLIQHVVYKVPGIITGIDVTTDWHSEADFTFYLSSDGYDFKDLEVKKSDPDSGQSWKWRIYTAENLTGGEQFLKIQFNGLVPNDNWAQQIGRVVIYYKRDTSLPGVAAYAPEYTDPVAKDVAGTEFADAVRKLNALEILGTTATGDFKPGDKVSCTEFAAAACKLAGILPADALTKSQDNVSLLKKNGFYDGVTSTKSEIKYEDAVKILVNILRAGKINRTDKSLSAYMSEAAQAGITSGITAEADTVLTRGTAALLLYNASNADVMVQTGFGAKESYKIQKGITPVNKYMDIEDDEGIVTENSATGLTYDTSDLKKDSVKIDNTTFKVGATLATSLLGYKVEYYYKDTKDGKILLFVQPASDTKTLSFTTDDVKKASKTGVEYYENGSNKTKKVTISSTADMIYNGKYLKFDAEKMMLDDTKITLVSNGGSAYDTVIVSHYEDYAVDRKAPTTETVYGKYEPNSVLELDSYNASNQFFIAKNGKEVTVEDINEWDALSVEKSTGSDGVSYTKVYVSDTKVTGTISSVTTKMKNGVTVADKVTVDDTEYSVSASYSMAAANGKAPELIAGDSGTFTLNVMGKIAVYNKEETHGGYAYLKAVDPGNGLSAKVKFRIFTAESKWLTAEAADPFYINDEKVAKSNIVSALTDAQTSSVAQLIKYVAGSDGNIRRMYTVKPENNFVKNPDAAIEKKAVLNNELTLAKHVDRPYFLINAKGFYEILDNNAALNYYACTDDTVIFNIPGDQYNSDLGEELYKVIPVGEMRDRRYMDTDFYDMDEYGCVGAVVSHDSNRNEIYSFENVYVVDKVRMTATEDGNDAIRVYLKYPFNPTQQLDYLAADNARISKVSKEAKNNADPKSGAFSYLKADDLAPGDFVQVILNGEGRINYVYRWGDASKMLDDPDYKSLCYYADNATTELGVIYGEFAGADLTNSLFNVKSSYDLHLIGIKLKSVFIVNYKDGVAQNMETTSLAGIADGDKVMVYVHKRYPVSVVVMRNN